MKVPVDVTIYHKSLLFEISNGEDYDELLNLYEIQDRVKFKSLLSDNILLSALENYSAYGVPMLSCDQLNECMQIAAADYHLQTLQDKVLINSFIDDDMNIVYKATSKRLAQDLLSNISLN